LGRYGATLGFTESHVFGYTINLSPEPSLLSALFLIPNKPPVISLMEEKLSMKYLLKY